MDKKAGDTMANIVYGDAGFFAIPDLKVWLPVYDYKKHKKNQQSYVDKENSGILCRKWRNGHCDYVADHASQGFDKIKKCNLNTMAVIQTPTETQWYYCVAIMPGVNSGTSLTTCTGQELRKVKWADLCAYTCNDATARPITMVFFKKGMKQNMAAFDRWYD